MAVRRVSASDYIWEKTLRILTLLLAILLIGAGLSAVTAEQGSLSGFLQGTEEGCVYDNWISHVAEGRVSSLNIYAPWDVQNNDFGDFHIPDNEELQAWQDVIEDFLLLDLLSVEQRLAYHGFPYEVVVFQDLDSGRLIYMLRETLNDDYDTNDTEDTADDEIGSFEYGWGLYIYDPSALRPIIITAPHPCDDYPSPVFALKAFHELDARFLLINGAGREVAYQPPYNSNNASISDPSRYEAHPFNVAYRLFADQIRGITGKTEFSLQIHTYDWNKYTGGSNVMLSAGHERVFPALPMRDDSRQRHDLINHTPWLVHPENSIGTHSEVTIDDYYSVNYDTYPVWYQDETHEFQIPLNDDLPGAEFNQQMLITEQQNLYDVYSPFLHVEMDELPKNYERNETNWRWFFGYDEASQTWNTETRWDRFNVYYSPWLDALNAVLDSMLTLDDQTGPSNPENLRLTLLDEGFAYLAWDRAYSYDFDTYEIHLSWSQGNNEFTQVFDRITNPLLAWQDLTTFTLELNPENTLYSVRILARDKHGNSSPLSSPLKIWNMGVVFESAGISAIDTQLNLEFICLLSGQRGFNIYRSADYGPYQLRASWHDDVTLQPQPGGEYAWVDSLVSNGTLYRYQISIEMNDGREVFHWQILTASPFNTYALTLTNQQNQQTRDFYLGVNTLSSDGVDALDYYFSSTSSLPLLIGSDLGVSNRIYQQDIRAPFDLESGNKLWKLRYRCQTSGVNLSLSPEAALLETRADLLLYDVQRGYWHDLRTGPYEWYNGSTTWKDLWLYWGKNLPKVQYGISELNMGHLGDTLDLHWEVVNRQNVCSVELWMCPDRDSLMLSNFLSPSVTEFSFTPQTPFTGARLLTLLHLAEGSSLYFYSPQRYTAIPENLLYTQPPGYALLSFPVSGFVSSVSELLGAAGTAYTLSPDGVWLQSTTVQTENGYLLSHPQAYQITLPAEYPLYVVSKTLNPGWNILANPHWFTYEMRNLRFVHGGTTKSYATMVAEGWFASEVYHISTEGVGLTDHILPCKSVVLRYNGTQSLTVLFDPNHFAGEAFEDTRCWNASLILDDGVLTADTVILGVADAASIALDASLDLPKLPQLPSATYELALHYTNAQTGADSMLQSEYRELFPDYNQVEKLWQLKVYVSDMRPLRLSLSNPGFPDGYSLEIHILGQTLYLTDGQQIWLDPPSSGWHSAWVKVRNYLPVQGFAEPAFALQASPNPFSATVTISFPPSKGEKLSAEIYNLRGQKVRNLCQEAIPTMSELIWDGCDVAGKPVAAGIYLLRVTQGRQTFTKRLIKF